MPPSVKGRMAGFSTWRRYVSTKHGKHQIDDLIRRCVDEDFTLADGIADTGFEQSTIGVSFFPVVSRQQWIADIAYAETHRYEGNAFGLFRVGNERDQCVSEAHQPRVHRLIGLQDLLMGMLVGEVEGVSQHTAFITKIMREYAGGKSNFVGDVPQPQALYADVAHRRPGRPCDLSSTRIVID